MQTLSIVKHFLTTGLVILSVSCNNDSSKHGTELIDSSIQTESPDSSTTHLPSAVEKTRVETSLSTKKCFENDGLKYKTTITIFSSSSGVTGKVTSEQLDGSATETADFTGSTAGDKLTITFKGTPPVVGDASEWTNKPWTIKKAGSKESLLIIFRAKNYDTKKWGETTYEFTTCQ